MVVIVRYGELALKGKNRVMFEKKLVENIKKTLELQEISYKSVTRPHGRIIINTQCQPDLSRVFGVVSFSYAIETRADINSIKAALIEVLPSIKTTFRITTQRIDKSLPFNSMQLDKEIGAFVVEKTNKKVSLKDFETEIGIELINKKAYIYTQKIAGPGGLPVGISGNAALIINDKYSILAGLLLLKRGLAIKPVIVSETVKNQPSENLLDLLVQYGADSVLTLKTMEELEVYLRKNSIIAIGVSDMENNFEYYDMDFLILRPLCGLPFKIIKEISDNYGL